MQFEDWVVEVLPQIKKELSWKFFWISQGAFLV